MKKTGARKIASDSLSYLLLVFFAALAALNYEVFIHPNSFAPAGVNGIATIIQYLFDFSIGYLSLLINIPMLVLAFFWVRRGYAVRTLVYVLAFSVAVLILQKSDFIQPLRFAAEDGGEAILASIAAGFFNGIHYSMSVRLGGCTGGTDVVAAFINRKKPEYDMVWLIFGINSVVIVASFFVYGMRYQPAILTIIYSFVSSRVSDGIIKSGRSAVRFEVITDHPDEIKTELMQKLRHGCTLMRVMGGFSGIERQMIVCVVNKRQIVDFERIVNQYPNTFTVVSNVNSTIGNFKHIK